MRVVISHNGPTLQVQVQGVKDKIETALHKAMREGASETSSYLRNELLNGEMLRDTRNHLDQRQASTTSLEPGELRRSVAVRATTSGNNSKMTIYLRGSDQLKYIAEVLHEGREFGWDITAVNRHALRFTFHRGMFEGQTIMQKSVHHPGIESRPFMHVAFSRKKEDTRRLVKAYVTQAMTPKV